MAVITLSRQYGSRGDEIAHRVCVMLGYRYFDKVMITNLATEMGLSPDEVIDYSEDQYQVESFFDHLLGRTRPVGQVQVWKENLQGALTLETRPVTDVGASTLIQGAILAAYREDDVVIVGRGGQALLQCKPGVLHVRIEAPWDDRIYYVEHREQVNRVIAQETLIKKDAAAADYLKRFHGVDWANPALYHLVLNSSKLSVDAAAQLITCAVRCLPVSRQMS